MVCAIVWELFCTELFLKGTIYTSAINNAKTLSYKIWRKKGKFISHGKVSCHKSLVLFMGFLERHQSEFEALFCLNTVKISFTSPKALSAFFETMWREKIGSFRQDKKEGVSVF